MKVLFVCTGNICRSPTAEGVFRHMLEEENLTDLIQTDGCGLEGWHTGKQPDQRSMNHAKQRGYDLSSLRARQITQNDFVDFDLILAMDEGHLRDMKQMADAEYTSTSVVVQAEDFELRTRGHIVRFDGFTKVQPPMSKNEDDGILPDVKKGDVLSLQVLEPKQHFTKPPARYSARFL